MYRKKQNYNAIHLHGSEKSANPEEKFFQR